MKFNLFQKLVRQWESLHPYNGAQAMKIRGHLDLNASRLAWHDALEVLGLGAVQIDGNSYRYQCLNGESANHTVQPSPPGMTVDQYITQEINRPFGPADMVPFRPFAIQEEGHYWLGLSYRHWVADSASIRLLMHEWFARQFDPAAASRQRLRTAAGGYLSLFAPYWSGWDAGETLLACMRWQHQFKRVRRIEDRKQFRDMSSRFMLLPTIEGLINQLRTAARANAATVNDIFITAIAEACNSHVPALHRFRRRNLAVGSIVDLRPHAPRPLDDVFDLLLGFTSVFCRPEHFDNWQTLLHAVTGQTHRYKKIGFAEASWLRMLGAVTAGKYLSDNSMVDFYRKRISLAGAISNVNLNRCWAHRYHPDPLLDYVRAAPTGPMTPLVFTTTTLGHGLSVGLTYRHAILPDHRAATLGASFMHRLQNIAQCPSIPAPITV